jgi:hypothetical protein
MSTNKIVYAELVLQIGSVVFYETKSQNFLFGKPSYYWKYMSSSDYFGPFNSLMEAGQHFDRTIRTPPSIPATNMVPKGVVQASPPPANVINVDFRTKKRIV